MSDEPKITQSEKKPCETCNDDPEVCATVPGLRHCEAAMRRLEDEPKSDKKGKTPRTDAFLKRMVDVSAVYVANDNWYDFAGQLECALAEANQRIYELCIADQATPSANTPTLDSIRKVLFENTGLSEAAINALLEKASRRYVKDGT